jgi:hypothetical protein
MKLKDAARHFDTCPVYDAYTGSLVARVQGSTFLESAKEGSTSARRVISAAPEVSFPSHSCLLLLDQIVLVGGMTPDEWNGSAIRKAYWIKRVTDSFTRFTPGQAALNSGGTATYGQREYLRETINSLSDSEIDPLWEIFLSPSLTVPNGTILKGVSTYYRVRSTFVDVDGFLTCMCDELDTSLTTVSFTTNGTYNPVSDTYGSTTVTTSALTVDFNKLYDYKTQADPKTAAGDQGLIVAQAAITPTNGQSVTISGQPWRVFSVSANLDAWLVQIRRA